MNENATAGAPRTIDRRTVVKGAAWSVPAIAAAVAMPLASASGNAPKIQIYADCLFNLTGVNIGRGFYVENNGTAEYNGTISVTEKITLSGLAALPGVVDVLFGLLLVQGILGGSTTGVSRGSWNRPLFSNTATRVVTLSAPLAANEKRSWGVALDAINGVLKTLSAVGLSDISHTATITSPTGNPPVTKSSDAINWELISSSC